MELTLDSHLRDIDLHKRNLSALAIITNTINSSVLLGDNGNALESDKTTKLLLTMLFNTTVAPTIPTEPSNGSTTSLMSITSTGQIFTDAIRATVKNESQYLGKTMQRHIDWTDLILALLLCVLIVITVIGNTLVILSVLTTRRLRTVTNCFVMSLAVADWLVGIFVMPPAVAVYLIGSWQLGWIFCNIWISLDVLLCTASILSLCAISIDRYLAVTQPLNYSRRRRSKRLALLMILIVWILALAITCPPILGWYDHRRKEKHDECGYNQNEGYVVFSAMGSFFIPMAVMVYVYVRISCVVAARHEHMTEIEVHKKHNKHFDVEVEADLELEQSSEHETQSPYRKRQSSVRHPTKSNVLNNLNETKETTTSAIAADGLDKNPNENKNGHYELTDSTHAIAQKRGVKIKNITPASNNEQQWSKCVHNSQHPQHPQPYSMKQNNVSVYEQCNIVKQNTRTHHKSLSNRILTLKRENKTTQTLSIVVGGFIVCWLPFFVCYLITPFLPNKSINKTLSTILIWLGWFNSAMNPFIYAFYSVDFRAAFWRLTFRRFCKNSTKAPYSSNIMSIRR